MSDGGRDIACQLTAQAPCEAAVRRSGRGDLFGSLLVAIQPGDDIRPPPVAPFADAHAVRWRDHCAHPPAGRLVREHRHDALNAEQFVASRTLARGRRREIRFVAVLGVGVVRLRGSGLHAGALGGGQWRRSYGFNMRGDGDRREPNPWPRACSNKRSLHCEACRRLTRRA